MKATTRELLTALQTKLNASDCYRHPAGGFAVCVDGNWSRITDHKARKITGIAAPKRVKRPLATTGWAGEWNALCAIVNAVSAGSRA